MSWLSQAGAVAATVALFLLITGALINTVSAELDDFAEETYPFGK